LLKGSSSQPERTYTPDTFALPDMSGYSLPEMDIAPSSFQNWMSKYGVLILKYGLIILAAAAFIMFMISPLINRGKYDKKLKPHERLLRVIADWLKGMSAAIASFFAFLKRNENQKKINRPNSQDVRRAAQAIMNVYSQAKKQDIRRSVTLFARLIIWGSEACHTDWKPSYAPVEYCRILSAAAVFAETPGINKGDTSLNLNDQIIRCGELFEQALYSANVLTDEEQREFKKLVEGITEVG